MQEAQHLFCVSYLVEKRGSNLSSKDKFPKKTLGWAVLSLVGIFFALTAWSFSSAVGASPDDDFHLASIWCGAGDKPGLCQSTGEDGHRLVLPGLVESGCFVFDSNLSAKCQIENNLFTNLDLIDSTRGSFTSNYPPVYYGTTSIFASTDIQTSVLLIRIFNSVFFIASLVALMLISPKQQRITFFWMWSLTAVPLGIFLIASTNPSSWAITAVPTAWMALYVFLTSREKLNWASGALFGVEVFLASGARGDAAIYTIIGSALIAILTWERSRSFLTKLLLPAVMAVVSFLFYANSLQSTVASSGLASTDGSVPRSPLSVLAINSVQIPELWVGAFGYWPLGWLDTQMPTLVWTITAGLFVAVVFVLMKGIGKRHAVVVSALALVLYVLPLYVLQRGLNFVGEQVQPRYLLPLIVGFAAILFLRFSEPKQFISLWQSRFILVGIAIANSVALYVNTKRYVSGLNNGTGISIDGNIEWWWDIPISPMAVWVIGTMGFITALSAGFKWISLQKVEVLEVSDLSER